MSILLLFLLFGISLFVLIKSSDYFVNAAVNIATFLGISEFIIGLTIVSLGTSLPELASSIFASLTHNGSLVIGNVIGSNVANIGLILGITALFINFKIDKELFSDVTILILVTTLFFIFSFGGFNRFEGFLLLLGFLVYTGYIFDLRKKFKKLFTKKDLRDSNFVNPTAVEIEHELVLADTLAPLGGTKAIDFLNKQFMKSLSLFFVSLIFVLVGANFTVNFAVEIAHFFNVPEFILGVTLIAIGTSLPELVVSIQSAKKKHGNLMLGNVIGSNIENILLVFGTATLINPIASSPFITYVLMPFMFMLCFSLYLLFKKDVRIKRFDGAILLSFYILFIILNLI